MSYAYESRRARGGNTASVAQNTQVAVSIPATATKFDIVSTVTGARYVVSNTNAALTKTATNMGYLVANIPAANQIMPGTDTWIILNSDVAGPAVIYITFYN